jgi:hypothetical protein
MRKNLYIQTANKKSIFKNTVLNVEPLFSVINSYFYSLKPLFYFILFYFIIQSGKEKWEITRKLKKSNRAFVEAIENGSNK